MGRAYATPCLPGANPLQVTYVAFHYVKGTPFDQDQGAYKHQTYWEQLDYGKQYTATRKFYTAVPIVLYVAEDVRTMLSLASQSFICQAGDCQPLLFREAVVAQRSGVCRPSASENAHDAQSPPVWHW